MNTIQELHKEAKREGNMRRVVYRNSAGAPDTKARQLKAMDSIEKIMFWISQQDDIMERLGKAGLLHVERELL